MKEIEEKRKRGRPKTFRSGEQLLLLFEEFCQYIVEQRDYEVIPSQTNFCSWLKENKLPADRRTIYLSLEEYYPTVKKEYYQMVSDVLAQGAMVGKYNPTMTIFTLKNWCNWRDKTEREHSGGVEIAFSEDAKEWAK